MRRHKSITEVKAALRKHGAILTVAANELGICRQTLHERVAKSRDLQAYVHDLENEILNAAVGVINEAIVVRKDIKTSRWYAERKGKHLGFGTRPEAEGRISDAQLEAIVTSLGGDIRKLRAARAVIQDEKCTTSASSKVHG